MEPKDRIIVAIDTNDFGRAIELVDKLSPHVGAFKIGLEFITAALVEAADFNQSEAILKVNALRRFFTLARGKIFLDGKFHDIPNTAAGAAKALVPLGVKFFNVHASSGPEAVRRAVENKGEAKLLVVTVLTSLNFADLWNIGFGRCRNPECGKYATTEWSEKFVEELVLNMARWSKAYGADGIICSPKELKILNQHGELRSFLKVTPGVRPEWAASGDQKRVMTPGEAVRLGADYLVIGRPITASPDPVEAANLIIKEIEEAEKEAGNAG